MLTRIMAMILAISCYGSALAATTSAQSGLWSQTATWVGNVVPTSGDDVVIAPGHTVTVDDVQNCKSLDIQTGGPGGTLTISASGSLTVGTTITNNGGLNNSGALNCSDMNTVTFTNNGTLQVGGNLGLSGNTVTNNKILDANSLSGGTFVQGTSSTLTVHGGGTPISVASADFSTNINTVMYINFATPQNIFPTSYSTLRCNNSSGTQLTGATTVNAALKVGDAVANSVFKDAGQTLTANGATLDMNFGGTYVTSVAMPAFSSFSLTAGTTIEYATGSSTIVSTIPYQNLKVTGTGPYTFAPAGAASVAGSLILNGPTTAPSGTFTISGSVSGTAVLTLGASDVSVGGNWTNSGGTSSGAGKVVLSGDTVGTTFENIELTGGATHNATGPLTITGKLTNLGTTNFTDLSGTGGFTNAAGATASFSGLLGVSGAIDFSGAGNTIDYNSTSDQTVLAVNYSNLTVSGSRSTHTVTLAAGTIGVAGTFTNSATFSSGGFDATGNTFDYNGNGAQTIANLKYNNLTISGARNTNNVTFSSIGIIGVDSSFTASASFSTGSYVTTGSTFNYGGSGAQSVIAFPYHHLLIGGGAIKSLAADTGLNGDLIIAPGATFDVGAHTVGLAGNLNNNGGTLTTSGSLFHLHGAAPQAIGGVSNLDNLNIDNSSAPGVAIGTDLTISTSLTLTTGRLVTGPNQLILAAAATSSPGSATSYIDGQVTRNFASGTGLSFAFPVGDNAGFAPVTVSGLSTTGAASLIVTSKTGDSASISSARIDSAASANRVWSIMPIGGTTGTVDATFNFLAAEVDAGADPLKFVLQRFDGAAWIPIPTGTAAATSISGTGIPATQASMVQAGQRLPLAPATLAVSQDLVKTGTPVTFTATVPASPPVTFSWDFADGSPAATDNPTSHAFTAPGTFTVTLTINDGLSSAQSTINVTALAPASGGAGVTNVDNGKPVINPLDGLSLRVASSDGGVIELEIDVSSLTRAAYDVSTTFDGISGRLGTRLGTRPIQKLTESGLVVATASAKDSTTQETKGKGRLTIAVSGKETGETSLITTPPTSTAITAASLKGKFLFKKATPDLVSFAGTIELPAGLDLSKEQQLSFGMGNVIDTVPLDTKGRAKSTGTLQRIKKLSIKYPKLSKGTTTTTAGQLAKISISMSTADMDVVGFDTEGITAAFKPSEQGQKSVQRDIQVAMVVAGVAYKSKVPVAYKLTPKGDTGSLSGRSSK